MIKHKIQYCKMNTNPRVHFNAPPNPDIYTWKLPIFQQFKSYM